MNRIKDHASFAAWFAGLGYIMLWPLTSPELGGWPFGSPILCRGGSPGALDLLCNSPHPLELPLGLHALGFMSAVFATIRLLVYAIRRSRRAVNGAGAEAVDPAAAAQRLQSATAFVMSKPSRQKAPPPLRTVKPRNHFGLRGIPH